MPTIANNRAPFFTKMIFVGACLCMLARPIFTQDTPTTDLSGSLPACEPEVQEVPQKSDWFTIKSNYFDVYCKQSVDLKAIANQLERRGLFVSGVYDPNPASAPTEKVAYRLDRILKRVKEILDMYPDMPDMKIKIFKDRSELAQEYYHIFNEVRNYKAFYINQYKTIYTSEEDISDNVIAHEMGHAVVDHYFSVVPPEKVRELLATYVDMHLQED